MKGMGGKIMTVGQVEGVETIHDNWTVNIGMMDNNDQKNKHDPPRVWNASLERPGCHYTRSLGDSIGEMVGVISDPEITRQDVDPQNELIILATNGLFEYLPNNQIIKVLSKYDDVLFGAKMLLGEASELCFNQMDSTNDMTVIVIKIGDISNDDGLPLKRGPVLSRVGTESSSDNQQQLTKEEQKLNPPRKLMRGGSSNRRLGRMVERQASLSYPTDEDHSPVIRNVGKNRGKVKRFVSERKNNFDWDDFIPLNHVVEKTDQDIEKLHTLVRSNFLFRHITNKQKEDLFHLMIKMETFPNQVIITQGEEGDHFYILESGEYSVTIGQSSLEEEVFRYEHEGESFGELALLYGAPRAATITTVRGGILWKLGRKEFKKTLMKRKSSPLDFIKILRNIEPLKGLSTRDFEQMSSYLEEACFMDGTLIGNAEILNSNGVYCWVVTHGKVLIKKKKGKTELRIPGTILYGSEFEDRSTSSPMESKKEEEGDVINKEETDDDDDDDERGEKSNVISEVLARGNTTLGCISHETFNMFMDILHSKINFDDKKRKRTRREVETPRAFWNSKYSLSRGGDFGNFGFSFKNLLSLFDGGFTAVYEDTHNGEVTIRAISKDFLVQRNLESNIMKERQILEPLSKSIPGIPLIACSMTDPKMIYYIYETSMKTDFQSILAEPLPPAAAVFYLSSIITTLFMIHDKGAFHRLICASSFYLSDAGYPMLCDLRFLGFLILNVFVIISTWHFLKIFW